MKRTILHRSPAMCAFVSLLLTLVSNNALSDSLDCDRLAGSQQMLCVAMARCTLIDDGEARSGCVSAVLQAVGLPAMETRAPVAAQTVRPVSESPAVATAPARTETKQPKIVETAVSSGVVKSAPTSPPSSQPVEATQPAATGGSGVFVATNEKTRKPIAVPKKFTAIVLSARDLIQDRQIVYLDNNLLFEGAGPAFDPGETVTVAKRGRFGQSHTMASKKNGSREVKRLLCELEKRNKDTARKCDSFQKQ